MKKLKIDEKEIYKKLADLTDNADIVQRWSQIAYNYSLSEDSDIECKIPILLEILDKKCENLYSEIEEFSTKLFVAG